MRTYISKIISRRSQQLAASLCSVIGDSSSGPSASPSNRRAEDTETEPETVYAQATTFKEAESQSHICTRSQTNSWWQGEEHLDYLQDRESAGNQEPDGNHQDKWRQQGHLRHCAWCCQGRLPRGITQPQPYASKQLPRLPLRYTDLWLVTWWPLYLLLIGFYLFIQGHNEDGKGKDILQASSS